MQILEIKVLKGPNYWSVRRTKLIQMKLDLEEKKQEDSMNELTFRDAERADGGGALQAARLLCAGDGQDLPRWL